MLYIDSLKKTLTIRALKRAKANCSVHFLYFCQPEMWVWLSNLVAKPCKKGFLKLASQKCLIMIKSCEDHVTHVKIFSETASNSSNIRALPSVTKTDIIDSIHAYLYTTVFILITAPPKKFQCPLGTLFKTASMAGVALRYPRPRLFSVYAAVSRLCRCTSFFVQEILGLTIINQREFKQPVNA